MWFVFIIEVDSVDIIFMIYDCLDNIVFFDVVENDCILVCVSNKFLFIFGKLDWEDVEVYMFGEFNIMFFKIIF